MLLDAVDCRAVECLDMEFYKLLTIAQKSLPQRTENKHEVVDMTKVLRDSYDEVVDIDVGYKDKDLREETHK